MTLEEKLNFHCDETAKKEIKSYVATRTDRDVKNTDKAAMFSLPLEAARVFVNGVKQTTDVGKGFKHHIGRHQAKEFYQKKAKNPLLPQVFDVIDWEATQLVLKGRPQIHKCTSFGTGSSAPAGAGQTRILNIGIRRTTRAAQIVMVWTRTPLT